MDTDEIDYQLGKLYSRQIDLEILEESGEITPKQQRELNRLISRIVDLELRLRLGYTED